MYFRMARIPCETNGTRRAVPDVGCDMTVRFPARNTVLLRSGVEPSSTGSSIGLRRFFFFFFFLPDAGSIILFRRSCRRRRSGFASVGRDVRGGWAMTSFWVVQGRQPSTTDDNDDDKVVNVQARRWC